MTPTLQTMPWQSISAFENALRKLWAVNPHHLSHFIAGLDLAEAEFLNHDWPFWARPGQRIWHGLSRTVLMLGGRGAGKTRAGAEWIRAVATGHDFASGDSGGRVALIGESYDEVRDVMVEGHAGLLSVHRRDECPAWSASRRRLEWKNGVIGEVFSANDPEGLRGSQFGVVWCDELAKWPYAQETYDILQFCLRLGQSPKQVITTTPKPLGLIKRLVADAQVKTLRTTTRDNAANLAPGFVEYLEETYGKGRIGRQELLGEIIEEREGALWKRDVFERHRVRVAPSLERVVVAVDPPVTSNARSDNCGIVVAGRDASGRVYVLKDATLSRATPALWAATVAGLYHDHEADLVVVEANQGGDMVRQMIAQVDTSVPVRAVHATRGKVLRAEPVAMLYERGLVSHVGTHPLLEDQMCDFGPGGLSTGRSPDRLDAAVWAITELALNDRARPRIRKV